MAPKNEQKITKPIMLKEFLRDTNLDSSNGFQSFPRSLPDYNSDPSVRTILDHFTTTATSAATTLPRSRSKSRAAAEAAFSSFQKLLHAVKTFHYPSSSPSPLPRSLSRRLLGKWYTKKKRDKNDDEVKNNSKIMVVTVKVKDILKWKSFRDLNNNYQVYDDNHEVESQPLDLVVGATDIPASSSVSSESSEDDEEGSTVDIDSDFTVAEEEELPCCLGNYSDDDEDDEGNKWDHCVASDSGVGPKEDNQNIANEDDTEQQSPVSVLNSPFRDEVSDEESLSSFDRSLANMERTKQRLLQSIQWFESLAGVEDDDDDESEEIEEEERQEDEQIREEDNTVEAKSKARSSKGICWFKRGGEGLEEKRECIKGMERERQWNKFEEETTELGVELEVVLLNDLLDELLTDLCA